MAHFITEKCIGCTACARVCPTRAIEGERKERHRIDPSLCIDCGVCTRVCPATAIRNPAGVFPPRLPRRSDWPRPVINPLLCSGCEFCVSICPFDCLEVAGGAMQGVSRLVRPEECVGCGMCASVCIKEAITLRPLAA